MWHIENATTAKFAAKTYILAHYKNSRLYFLKANNMNLIYKSFVFDDLSQIIIVECSTTASLDYRELVFTLVSCSQRVFLVCIIAVTTKSWGRIHEQ